MKPRLRTLAGVPLFRDLTRRQLGFLATISEDVRFERGASIARMGDRAGALVIADGHARATFANGGVLELGPGAVLGLDAVLLKPEKVVALSPVSAVLFGRAQLLGALASVPELGARALSGAVRDASEIRRSAQVAQQIDLASSQELAEATA